MRRAAARLSAAGSAPVSVIDCIDRWDARGLVVLEDRLHPGLRGGLSLVEGRWLIILNQDDSPTRARFTLAHELGHIVLGDGVRGDVGLGAALDQVIGGGAPGPGRGRSNAVREALCDRFAVELLLPAALVRFAWVQEPDVAALARRFDVSRAAARRRIRELGLEAV